MSALDPFAAAFDLIEQGAGASELTWEVATRCTTPRDDGSPCYSEDSRQANWQCPDCGGLGAVYAPPVTIRAIFRGQSRWVSKKASGEYPHGEAQLSTLHVEHKPAYTDGKIKDRLTVISATDDTLRGRVFYPVAQPVPFIIGNVHRGWRVQLQALEQATRTKPQP